MPSVPKEYEKTVRGHIRRLLIMDGSMTNIEIQKQLEKIGIPFKVEYIGKQRQKIAREKLYGAVHRTVMDYLQNFIDSMSEADRQLWSIATNPKTAAGNRIYALSQIRENRKAIFDKLFEAGVFEKQLGSLNLRTFKDIVKDVEANPIHEPINATPSRTSREPKAPRLLEEKSGGVHQNDVGQGLADLVRSTASADERGEQPPDSSA